MGVRVGLRTVDGCEHCGWMGVRTVGEWVSVRTVGGMVGGCEDYVCKDCGWVGVRTVSGWV